jgi:hypothetical protein
MSYYGKLILMNNNTIFVIILLVSTFLTSTLTMLPAAHAGGGDDDDHDKRGDSNKQRVEEDGAGAIADCDWNDIEESGFRCKAAAATDEGKIRDGGTTPPPTDGAFTVTGEGSEGSAVCDRPTQLEFVIIFSAQGDGTLTGSYTVSTIGFVREGVITEGTTDGNTYTLSGENLSICGNPSPVIGEITISGDCGDDVTITYEDPATVVTFEEGDVDCTLL